MPTEDGTPRLCLTQRGEKRVFFTTIFLEKKRVERDDAFVVSRDEAALGVALGVPCDVAHSSAHWPGVRVYPDASSLAGAGSHGARGNAHAGAV